MARKKKRMCPSHCQKVGRGASKIITVCFGGPGPGEGQLLALSFGGGAGVGCLWAYDNDHLHPLHLHGFVKHCLDSHSPHLSFKMRKCCARKQERLFLTSSHWEVVGDVLWGKSILKILSSRSVQKSRLEMYGAALYPVWEYAVPWRSINFTPTPYVHSPLSWSIKKHLLFLSFFKKKISGFAFLIRSQATTNAKPSLLVLFGLNHST